jgi:hypothetical protein
VPHRPLDPTRRRAIDSAASRARARRRVRPSIPRRALARRCRLALTQRDRQRWLCRQSGQRASADLWCHGCAMTAIPVNGFSFRRVSDRRCPAAEKRRRVDKERTWRA